MKKFTKSLILIFLLLNLSYAASFPEPGLGQKYYMVFMKNATGMKGSDFTKLQTMLEWKELFDNDGEKFIEVYSNKFPALEPFLRSEDFQKFRVDLRHFFMFFAKDALGVAAGC
ncbi:MAG: hypothetical protein ACK5LP_01950 [Campylobacteraceae bacterium]